MSATLEKLKPGVYNMPEAVYHADPVPGGSLSSTGARKLLTSTPARFDWDRKHSPLPSGEMELGSAAHMLVLGSGPEIIRINAENWRKDATKEEAASARTAGKIPLLAHDHETVLAMAAAISSDPVASRLFDGGSGDPEQVLIWQDAQTGVWCRARLDWLPVRHSARRLIIRDYKTTKNAHPKSIPKSVADFGYHQQAAFYIDGIRALGLDRDPAFVFIFQEKEAPYLVSVAELDSAAIRAGREENRRALEIYRDCSDSGVWPGYSREVELISLPAWKLRAIEGNF